MTLADFNAHLDTCKRCRGPWELCALGQRILEQAARDTAAQIAPMPRERATT